MGVLPKHGSQHHSLTTPVTLVTYHIHLSSTPSHLSLWLPNPIHTQTLILTRSVKQQDSQWTRSSVLRSASTCSTLRRWSSSLQMTMKRELKDAFRIYDKEGLGYITTETLRGLISELLAPLSDEELEGILEELDEDGSGSMDFDEFCEMMMTKPE